MFGDEVLLQCASRQLVTLQVKYGPQGTGAPLGPHGALGPPHGVTPTPFCVACLCQNLLQTRMRLVISSRITLDEVGGCEPGELVRV